MNSMYSQNTQSLLDEAALYIAENLGLQWMKLRNLISYTFPTVDALPTINFCNHAIIYCWC